MKNEPTLRLAHLTDARRLALMSRELIEYGLRWRWTPSRVAASIRAADVNVLVACVQEKIIGFAIMSYGEEDAHLDLLAVAPQYRRVGVGELLVGWLEECARVAGIFDVTLEVRVGNEGAQSFYKQLGYCTLLHLPGYYQGREAALRMGRDLSRRSLSQGTQNSP